MGNFTKKTASRKERREDFDRFAFGEDDVAITPFLSSAEIYKRFGAPKEGSSARGKNGARQVEENANVRDAFGDSDSDLWNKGSANFRRRRRASLAESKRGRRNSDSDANLKSVKRNDPKKQESSPLEKPKRSKRNKNVGSEPGARGDAVGLRVIGGTFRGTKLEYGGDRRVRPMKERVREAVFNLLGESVKGKHVVDLFAGTGALAFEAISRGARSATMFEIHFPTARVTRRNIAILDEKEPGAAQKFELITTDVFFWGRKLKATDPDAPVRKSAIESSSQASLTREVPWLVFCSPPYDFWIEREEETLNLLNALRERAPEGSIFVVESDDRFDFELLNAEIPPKKRRSYPPAEVGVFTR